MKKNTTFLNWIQKLFDLIASKCNRETRRVLKVLNKLLIIDSTTITAGKGRILWAVYHGE